MSAVTATGASLRQILLDALDVAFWQAQGEVEMCVNCGRSPAKVCAAPDHQTANAAAREFEQARKQVEGSLADDRWTAELAALLGTDGTEGEGTR